MTLSWPCLTIKTDMNMPCNDDLSRLVVILTMTFGTPATSSLSRYTDYNPLKPYFISIDHKQYTLSTNNRVYLKINQHLTTFVGRCKCGTEVFFFSVSALQTHTIYWWARLLWLTVQYSILWQPEQVVNSSKFYPYLPKVLNTKGVNSIHPYVYVANAIIFQWLHMIPGVQA